MSANNKQCSEPEATIIHSSNQNEIDKCTHPCKALNLSDLPCSKLSPSFQPPVACAGIALPINLFSCLSTPTPSRANHPAFGNNPRTPRGRRVKGPNDCDDASRLSFTVQRVTFHRRNALSIRNNPNSVLQHLYLLSFPPPLMVGNFLKPGRHS